jgi:hypothetical protein
MVVLGLHPGQRSPEYANAVPARFSTASGATARAYEKSYPFGWLGINFDRCLWETDWMRAFTVVNYEQAVEPFRMTDHLSDTDRAMLMGGACAKAYGWPPKKG